MWLPSEDVHISPEATALNPAQSRMGHIFHRPVDTGYLLSQELEQISVILTPLVSYTQRGASLLGDINPPKARRDIFFFYRRADINGCCGG